MAYLEKRNNSYRLIFRVNGKRFSRFLETSSEPAENLALAKMNDGLHRLKKGVLQLEPDDDLMTVLLSSGAVRQPAVIQMVPTVGKVLDAYLESVPEGAIETSSRGMLLTHHKNLKRHIGIRISSNDVNLATIQGYINSRSQDPGIRGAKISPVTIRKEITTFCGAWTWAKEAGMVSTLLPRKARLRYPKRQQKPPFKTWNEIERVIKRGQLSEAKQRDHWDCLFLSQQQTVELVADVSVGQAPAGIKAMIAMAAFTGARRSGLLRAQIEDIDLEANKFTIREKKRIRSQHSTRSVPICKSLHQVVVHWFDQHPGGEFAFTIEKSQLTRDQAHDYFVRSLQNTKWKVLRGWHCLRHSFISNCAARNVDQRIIDDWVGHQTDAMRKRYRHLFPNVQQAAIESVFGSTT